MDQTRIKSLRFIFAAFLVGIAILSFFKYMLLLKERYSLLLALEQEKKQMLVLVDEKQGLLLRLEQEKTKAEKMIQENKELDQQLKLSEDKAVKLKKGFSLARAKIGRLNSCVSILKSENIALRQEGVNLKTQLDQLNQENTNLKDRLSSIPALRKILRALRIQVRRKVNGGDKAGNRGFLIKDGQPTGTTTVKIEVNPAPAK
jgi:hypothetical protein